MMKIQEYYIYIDKIEACLSRLRTFGRYLMRSWVDEFLCRLDVH